MTRDNLFIILERLNKMHEDLEYLRSYSKDNLLTPDMEQYYEETLTFLNRLFCSLHDNIDLYMSSLPHPNDEGFIKEKSGDAAEQIRVLKNFSYFEQQFGKYDLKDPNFAGLNRLGSHSSEQQQYQQQQYVNQNQAQEVKREAEFDGLAAGFAIASDPANNPLTEEDYFQQQYREEESPPPAVNASFSPTKEDLIEDLMDSDMEDMPIY